MSALQVIPRGSNELVSHIKAGTKIPVMGHADGICHIYVAPDADMELACTITIDSKTQYPSACNAVEKLLVHEGCVSSGKLDFLLVLCPLPFSLKFL